MTPFEHLDTGILIIGAGGAGLMAALHARTANPTLPITIAVKGLLGQSGCTRMVQGGYNAVLNPADSLERHFEDTIKGGAYLNNQELAWTLVREAPDRIVELENRVGCMFDRNADGTIHQKAFAGQSFDRTVHKGDLTGIEIMSNLRDWILEQDIRVLEETRALDLLPTGNGAIAGALLHNNRTGRFIAVRAKATLIATGGGATMYRISSPSLEKSGDGMAIARRAGAAFIDMEMLQFHPTGLLVGASIATGGLLEEGLRGAGARLFNGKGERYRERDDPVKLERATRDVISRSSYMEIRAGRGTPAGGVFIDASHLGEAYLLKNFPGMVERCAGYGFDLLHEPVEVSPSAHFQMGGIKIDTDCHTSLHGLFAAGEDAGGVHGANRLGGNGVADSIVFGARAGDAMNASAQLQPVSQAFIDERIKQWTAPLTRADGPNPFRLRKRLEDLMWDHAGVIRNAAGLATASASLAELEREASTAHTPGPIASNPAWNELLDLTNLIAVGQMLVQSAALRTESRGAHYREDFPQPDPAWLRNILLEGEATRTEDVLFSRLKPPE